MKFLIIFSLIMSNAFGNCKYSGNLEKDLKTSNEIREGITIAAFEYNRLKTIKKKEKEHKDSIQNLKQKYVKYKVILKMLDQKIVKYNDCVWRL